MAKIKNPITIMSGTVSLETQQKTVTPNETTQIVTPDAGYDGLSKVTVEPIPPEYAPPDAPTYDGSYETPDGSGTGSIGYELQANKAVIPTNQFQIVKPDAGYDGLKAVTVAPIPNDYIMPEGTLEISENGEYDVTAFANVDVDVEPNLGEITANITASGTYEYIPTGEYEGLSKVTVTVEDRELNLTGIEVRSKDITEVITAASRGVDGFNTIIVKPIDPSAFLKILDVLKAGMGQPPEGWGASSGQLEFIAFVNNDLGVGVPHTMLFLDNQDQLKLEDGFLTKNATGSEISFDVTGGNVVLSSRQNPSFITYIHQGTFALICVSKDKEARRYVADNVTFVICLNDIVYYCTSEKDTYKE